MIHLYNILIQSGIPMILAGLIKMSLNKPIVDFGQANIYLTCFLLRKV